MTDADWEAFLERLLEQLHELRARGVMADILVMLRRNKQTGEEEPPRSQVRFDFS